MKKLAIIVTSIIIIVALPLIVYLVGQRQEIRQKAAPATTLAMSPPTLTKKTDDVFSMEVTIDTGENQVVAAELHLTFDPTKLEAQTVSNGSLFPNILASGTVESGAASITVGAANSKQPVKGTGTVAVVRFKALAKTDSPTAVKLASNTFVGGLGEGAVNVLVGTTPATVTIAQSQPQTTPSPTQTMTPAATPTPQATGSSTLSLTPTLTPTPTGTASAQSSAGATVSAILAINAPTKDGTAVENKPIIRGKASPGATITLTIYSTPQTVTVTADENGNWVYTPSAALDAGPHNIVASVTDQSGQTQTATAAFVVASSGRETGGATESAIPVSGTVETTLLLLTLGFATIGIGVMLQKQPTKG
ncbi:hypothetical protein HY087_01245 [Candidatus Gottesmanbacteria bacterium]|nr:hypothetical protein [Candidatus Gottesmanbacteria bacterium]